MCVCATSSFLGTQVYVVPGVCSCVESNSVLLVVANNDTSTSAVTPTRRGAHEKTYGREDGTTGETSMPPSKCGCFGSAA